MTRPSLKPAGSSTSRCFVNPLTHTRPPFFVKVPTAILMCGVFSSELYVYICQTSAYQFRVSHARGCLLLEGLRHGARQMAGAAQAAPRLGGHCSRTRTCSARARVHRRVRGRLRAGGGAREAASPFKSRAERGCCSTFLLQCLQLIRDISLANKDVRTAALKDRGCCIGGQSWLEELRKDLPGSCSQPGQTTRTSAHCVIDVS